MRQAVIHRSAPLTIRVPRITLATPRGNPRTPLLQPLAIPHEQRPLAGIAQLPDHVRRTMLVPLVQLHRTPALLPRIPRHDDDSSRSRSPTFRHHPEPARPNLTKHTADHLLRDTRPERGLDPPVPVPAPGIGERPRHAGAQPGVLADADPGMVVVVAAGRDTAASMSATSANTSAPAGRPASSSPCSTGAAGRRPGLFLRPRTASRINAFPNSSSRIRRRSTSGSSPNGSLSVPA
mgnify:CR=1 FL=1